MKRLTRFSFTIALAFIFVKSFAQLDTTAFLTKWYRCIKLNEDLPSFLMTHFEVKSVDGRLVGYFPEEIDQKIKDHFQLTIDCYNENSSIALKEKITLVHHFKFYKTAEERDLKSPEVHENLDKYKKDNHLLENNTLDIIARAGPIITCGHSPYDVLRTSKPPPQVKSLKIKI